MVRIPPTPHIPLIQKDPYWTDRVNVADQKADQSSLWHSLRTMIQLRKRHPALRSRELAWIPCSQQSVVAYLRRSNAEQVAVVQNLAVQPVSVEMTLEKPSGELVDLLTGRVFRLQDGWLKIILRPCEYLWLV